MQKGGITISYTVWCATCHEWQHERVSLKSGAALRFEKSGWKKKRKIGWICPICDSKVSE